MSLLSLDWAELQRMINEDRVDDYVLGLLDSYEKLGPLPGILLPLIEAFLPFLPLFVFVIANSIAYGLLEGFLFSWIGSTVGAILVFLLFSWLGDKKLFKKIRERKQVKKVTTWFGRHGFGPLFLLLCFPFSPSAIINIVAALSKVKFQQFVLAVILGKAVMIFTIAYIGESISSFATQPIKSIIVGLCIFLFWGIGKYVEKRLSKRSVESEADKD